MILRPLLGSCALVVALASSLGAQRARGDDALRRKADSLRVRANALLTAGNGREALDAYRREVGVRAMLDDRTQQAHARVGMAAAYATLGRPDSTVALYALALRQFRLVADSAGLTSVLNGMGYRFNEAGRRDSAMVNFREALAIARAMHDRNAESLALHGVAFVFEAVAQPDSSAAYLADELAIIRDLGDASAEAVILNNIGASFLGRGRPDSAVRYYRLAAERTHARGEVAREASALSNIGVAQLSAGQHDSALASLRAALPLRLASNDPRALAITYLNLGLVFDSLGQSDSALVYDRRALQLARDAKALLTESEVLANVSLIQARRGDLRGAVASLRRASWLRTQLAATAPGDYLRVASADDASAGIYSAWARLALRVDAGARTTPDTLEAWAALERARGQALRGLRMPGRAPEDSLAPARAAAGMRAVLLRLARPGRAFLTFDTYRDTLLVLAISPAGTLHAARMAVPMDTLRRLTARVRALIGTPPAARAAVGASVPLAVAIRSVTLRVDPRTAAPDSTALRRLALLVLPAPVRRALESATEVVIVPDGTLSLVPWAALPVPTRDVTLGSRAALRIVPGLALLDEIASRTRTASSRVTRARIGDGALVVGDPAMPPGVDSLPGARAEAHWVADTLLRGARATLLLGAQATVGAVRRALASAPLVHLATHAAAFPEPSHSRSSFLQLAAIDARAPSVLTVGELLDDAEANRLTMRARLVVLSACETGIGAASATEGVLGLQRAFLALGAETLLVSLWKVDDAATRALMGAFYRHWFDDADAPGVAESLRRAQGDMREGRVPGWITAWARPNAWAAFQVVGAG